MVNYVNQPLTLGDQLAIYLNPTLQPTHHVTKDNLVLIYHLDQLIGINIQQPLNLLPKLSSGVIRHLFQRDIDTLNQHLVQKGASFVLPPFQSGFVIGEITQVEAHPDADALWICQVNLGGLSIQVVTNSSKVKPKHRVVVARPGAMLMDGQVIEEGLMMKEKSQGMFCSQKTLGISPETQVGVYILHEDAPIGKDFYGQ